MDSFRAFFYLLDQCYERCPEYDLGGFLGAISPEPWDDGMPMDMAVYRDWHARNDSEIIDSANLRTKTYEFLESYETAYGYRFPQTRDVLLNQITGDVLERAISYASHLK